MDTLDLNIDDGVGGNGHTLLERHELAHDGLGLGLGGGQALKNILVVGELGEFAQIAGAAPVGADHIVEQASAGLAPWIQRRKVMPLVLLENFSG